MLKGIRWGGSGISSGCLQVTSTGRYFRHIQPGEGSEQPGGSIYPIWPVNISPSPRNCQEMWESRSMPGLLGLACCHYIPDLHRWWKMDVPLFPSIASKPLVPLLMLYIIEATFANTPNDSLSLTCDIEVVRLLMDPALTDIHPPSQRERFRFWRRARLRESKRGGEREKSISQIDSVHCGKTKKKCLYWSKMSLIFSPVVSMIWSRKLRRNGIHLFAEDVLVSLSYYLLMLYL